MHALNNVGSAELTAGVAEGREKLERSLALALAGGLEEHVARAHTNLGATGVELRDYALADRHLDAGIDYCRERDLDAWLVYMTGWRARSRLEQGHWRTAAACATAVLSRSRAAANRITPLAVLGRLRARRGDPDPWGPLDEATGLALATGELQRLVPVAVARAEARWLAGEPEAVGAETSATLGLALGQQRPWWIGELLVWRRRAGIADEPPPVEVAAPFQLELAGKPEAAGELWKTLGCPYEAAMALLASDREPALRLGLSELQRSQSFSVSRRGAPRPAPPARCASALGIVE